VDRLLSNAGIEVDAFFVRWVPYIVGERKSIEVAMDWTDFAVESTLSNEPIMLMQLQ
jgi:hypothetical protein